VTGHPPPVPGGCPLRGILLAAGIPAPGSGFQFSLWLRLGLGRGNDPALGYVLPDLAELIGAERAVTVDAPDHDHVDLGRLRAVRPVVQMPGLLNQADEIALRRRFLPFPSPRPAPCGGSGGKAYQSGPDQARSSPLASAAGGGPAAPPTWRAASVYGSPVAAIRARISCLRSLFCVMAVSFRRGPTHSRRTSRARAGEMQAVHASRSDPCPRRRQRRGRRISSKAGGHAPPLPAP